MNDKNERSVASAGSQNPCGWLVVAPEKKWFCDYFPIDASKDERFKVIALYSMPQPSLTEDERHSIKLASMFIVNHGSAASLRALLKRLT